MTRRSLFVTACAVAVSAGTASADGIISIDGFSGFEDLIDFSLVDFNNLPDKNGDIGLGVTVTNRGSGTGGPGWRPADWGSFFDNIPGSSGGAAMADNWGTSNLLFEFSSPINRVGMLLSTGTRTDYMISLFDTAGGLIDTVIASMPADTEAVFIGYEYTSGDIGSVLVFEEVDNGQIILLDDLRFEAVPAPGALAMLLVAGIGARRRRRA